MIHWVAIAIILCVEAVLCLVFLLPSPEFLRKQLADWCVNANIQRGAKIYSIITGVLTAEIIAVLLTLKAPPTGEKDNHEDYHHYIEDVLAYQRNGLLAGCSILLLFVLGKLCTLTKEVIRQTLNAETLKKQASSVSSEYMKVLSKEKGTGEDANDTEQLKEEIKSLQKELKNANAAVEAVTRRGLNQTAINGLLLEENKSLKNKLEDFELLLGEARKKKV